MSKLKLAPLMIDNPFHMKPRLPAPYGDVERWSWTQSSMKLFRRCKRKFYWRYVLGIIPRTTTAALWMGTAFHKCVGEWITSRKSMASIAAAHIESMEKNLTDTMAFYDQDELDKMQSALMIFRGMCMGYAAHHAADRKQWLVKKSLLEKEFCIPFDDFDFMGSIDQIVTERSSGDRVMVERKSASVITESYIDRLALDTQVRAYLFAAWKSGLPCKYVIYDVTKKTKKRRKTNENQEEFDQRIAETYMEDSSHFYRSKLRFNRQDLNAFQYELLQVHREFIHVLENAHDPADPREWGIDDQECNAYFKICTYQNLCLRGCDRGAATFFDQPETPYVELEQAHE